MTHPDLIERITRSLAYMLRHQPEKFDLEVDAFGYADLGEVVRALNERLGEALGAEDVEEAIASGDRVRYGIDSDRIRALYGHSIEVEPGESSKPPATLYVGLSARDAERAVRFGLRGGRRRFLHLALTEDDAREAGRRTGPEYAVVTVDALEAWEEGIDFYDRLSLWLAEEVPTHLLEMGEVHDDGFERVVQDTRGRGRRSGGRRDEGGRERGSRGGRGGRRDDRDDRRPEREAREDRPPARREREERPPARAEREERPPARAERDDRRPERPAREERQPALQEREVERPTPAPTAPRGGGGSAPGFGAGLTAEKQPEPQRRAPAPEPPRAPKPESKPQEAPEPEAPSSPQFGAGL